MGKPVTDIIFLGFKITADDDCSHAIKRHLLLERKAMTNLNSILKSRDITLPTKVHLVKAMVFPVVMYECESSTIKKAEHQRIDTFELWCWRRLLRVPCTAKRSNLSILKEISPEYSLEGLMLKLKLQYLVHLVWRTDSFEKTLMMGKTEGGRRRGWQMRWLDGITDSIDMSREAWHAAVHGVSNSQTTLSNWIELNWVIGILYIFWMHVCWVIANYLWPHRIYQSRILEQVAISSFRGSSWPRDQTLVSCLSCIGRQILLPLVPTGKPIYSGCMPLIRYIICVYFLPFHGLPFQPVDDVLWWTEVLNVDVV